MEQINYILNTFGDMSTHRIMSLLSSLELYQARENGEISSSKELVRVRCRRKVLYLQRRHFEALKVNTLASDIFSVAGNEVLPQQEADMLAQLNLEKDVPDSHQIMSITGINHILAISEMGRMQWALI